MSGGASLTRPTKSNSGSESRRPDKRSAIRRFLSARLSDVFTLNGLLAPEQRVFVGFLEG